MMKIGKRFGALMVSFAMVLTLAGCSPASSEDNSVSLSDVSSEDFYDALYIMPALIDESSSIEGGLSIQSDPSSKEIRMDLMSASDDIQQAMSDTADIARCYDLAVLQACMARAEDEGDEQLAQQWQAAIDEDESSDGLGRLYDEYTLYIALDNSEGTLDLTGLREAGAEGDIIWQ